MAKDIMLDQEYTKLMDKIDAEAVVILLNGKVVGNIKGRWYATKEYGKALQMGMRLKGEINYPDKNYPRMHYNVVKAGGCGYNKRKSCMEQLFRTAEDFIAENYGLEIKCPEHYLREHDGKPWYDWFNGWYDILCMTGFQVIEAL